MNFKKYVKHWEDESGRSKEVAHLLYKKRRYSEALFFGHLALEKILKALSTQHTQLQPPPIHNLKKLALGSDLLLTKDQHTKLDEISTFNIAGRYDDEKRSFYKKSTPAFAKKWMLIIEDLYVWLQKELNQRKNSLKK